MKKIFIFLTFLSALGINSNLYSQTPSFAWAHKWGNTNNDVAKSITTDNLGNLYATGYFEGSVYFGKNPATGINFTSNGGQDLCIAKLDALGNYLWVKQIGGSQTERGYSIAVDNSGNVYTTGIFTDTVDFDPGPGVYSLSTQSNYEVFISKLDSSGNFVWAKQFKGTYGNIGRNIDVDQSGNVYISGIFKGVVDFDPNVNTNNLTSDIYSHDIFLSELDSNGNFVWAKKISGNGLKDVNSSVLDKSNNLFITGSFQNTVDFDPSASGVSNKTASGLDDIFIAKYNSLGDFQWVKNFNGTNKEKSYGIDLSSNGSIYTTGFFTGTVDFDPGSGAFNMTANPFEDDMFISKLDSNGNFLWAKEFKGSNFCTGTSIDVDELDNVNVVGFFAGTTDFDPGNHTNDLTSNGFQDIFIAKYDPSGNFIWGKNIGGNDSDEGLSIAVDKYNNIYTSGTFSNMMDFNPYSGSYMMASSGAFDAFIHKFNSFTVGLMGSNETKNALVAYPNPSSGRISLKGKSVGEEGYLYDISGQLIHKFHLDIGVIQQDINLKGIKCGIYHLIIPGEFHNQQMKIVKMD